jgi:4-carboxymuconolactone decarboxylase
MTKTKAQNLDIEETLRSLGNGDSALMNQMTNMLKGSYEESGLEPETFMLVRLAALTAMDAAPASWLMNLKVGKELGIPLDSAIGTLIAISPVVGTARIVSAASSIMTALEIDKTVDMKSKQQIPKSH